MEEEASAGTSPNIPQEFLVAEDIFLTSGVHIGTQQKSAIMRPFIYKVRPDGLYVLDIKKTNKRIALAARFLANYDPQDILVVSARQYGQRPVTQFAKAVGARTIAGRFVPGTMTNPNLQKSSLQHYIEPEVLIVTDPAADSQALKEAVTIGIPIVALCDANNETSFVDLIIPANNKGRRSLALIYWLLSREIMKYKGVIESNDDYQLEIEHFEAQL